MGYAGITGEVHAAVAGEAKGKGEGSSHDFFGGPLAVEPKPAGPVLACARGSALGSAPEGPEFFSAIRFLHSRGGFMLRRIQTISIILVLAAPAVLAQSGDISGSTSNLVTLGTTILKVLVALAGMGFVGLIIWGGLTLGTNRPRGLAMIGGGLAGALLAGLAFALVNTLTGQSVSLS